MKRRAYGTKRYAVVELRERLRAYAKAKRAAALKPSPIGGLSFRDIEAHGMFLGAWSALCGTGAIAGELADRWMRRKNRVDSAKVTRRPFEPRAVRSGPVVCSFADELAGKAPPTFGPAAEGRAA